MPPSTPSRPDDPRRPNTPAGLPVAKLLPQTGKPPSRPQPPPAPRIPAADSGFEVVDDPGDSGFEVVDDTASVRSAGTRPDADFGFEVVDDAPPARRKRAIEADDDEVEAPRSKKRRVVEDDEDEAPRSKKRSLAGADDEEDTLRKRRRKKNKRKLVLTAEDEEKEREKENMIVDWGLPAFLTFVGMTMAIAGAIKFTGAVGAVMMAMMVIGMVIVTVPLTIVALMVIGMMVGIEYGTLGNALRNLTAITTMILGIIFCGTGFGVHFLLIYAIAPAITFGLFMTLFRLDVWETWITVTLLDVIQIGISMLFFIVIIGALDKAASRAMKDKDNDDPPAWMQRDNDWQQRPRGGRGPFDDDE